MADDFKHALQFEFACRGTEGARRGLLGVVWADRALRL